MTVLVVETGITYADGAAAIAALPSDQRYTLKLSGENAFSSAVSAAQFPFGLLIIPADGEGVTNDGDINNGAKITGTLYSTAPDIEIRDLRTNVLLLSDAPNSKLRRLIIDGNGADGLIFNDTIDAKDIIIHDIDDGVVSGLVRPNSLMSNITVVGAGRFGFANGKFNDCVDISSANQGFFGEQAGSTNLWEHDGSGTNTITESPTTDALVDYAAGKYGLKADSSPALSGAGAFINETSGVVDLVFSENTAQPIIDSVLIKRISQISIVDAIIQPTVDFITINNISSLSFNDLITNLEIDSTVIESISTLGISDLLVQSSIDSASIESIVVLDFSSIQSQPSVDTIDIEPASSEINLIDNLVQPTVDTISISNITELSINDLSVSVTGDSIDIVNITELSVSGLLAQPTTDQIVIDVIGGLVFSDVAVQPSIDTIAIELYTNLEFSDLSVQTTIDSILISTGVMPDFGNNDLLLIDNTASYLLVDNTTDYRII